MVGYLVVSRPFLNLSHPRHLQSSHSELLEVRENTHTEPLFCQLHYSLFIIHYFYFLWKAQMFCLGIYFCKYIRKPGCTVLYKLFKSVHAYLIPLSPLFRWGKASWYNITACYKVYLIRFGPLWPVGLLSEWEDALKNVPGLGQDCTGWPRNDPAVRVSD